ncbi:WD40 repeat domain-containing protein [Actinoplanes sp. CA-142083]|uniref:WD40 repeat domain-containing protein n=1 Tax=Actinoplanes sp. CA-142083 TaxID=3239903 RepID=UPI003D91BBF0
MTSAGPMDGLRAWAEAHARTVGRAGAANGGSRRPAPSVARPAPDPEPRMVRSFDTPFMAMGIDSIVLPDGRTLIACLGDAGELRVWDARTGELGCEREESVAGAAFGRTADGNPMLFIGSEDGSVDLCDPFTGAPRRSLRAAGGPEATALSAYCEPGVEFLAVGDSSGGLRVLDILDGTVQFETDTFETDLRTVALTRSPDGRTVWVIGADYDGAVTVYDVASRTPVGSLDAHEGTVIGLKVVPGPAGVPVLVIAGDGPEAVKVFDLIEFTHRVAVMEPEIEVDGSVGIVHRAGETLVVLPVRRGYDLWSIEKGRRIARVDVDFGLYELAFAEVDGRLMVISEHLSTSIDLWDVGAAEPEPEPAPLPQPGEDGPFRAEVESTVLNSQARDLWTTSFLPAAGHPALLALGSTRGQYEIWDLDSRRVLAAAEAVEQDDDPYLTFCNVALTRLDGRPVALIARDGSPFLAIDAVTGAPVCEVPHAIDLYGLPNTELADGRTVVAMVGDSEIPLLELPSGRQIATIRTPLPSTRIGLWLPRAGLDPLFLVSSREDGRVELWDPLAGTLMREIDHQDIIQAMAWTRLPDGRSCAAVGAWEGRVTLWDIERAERIGERVLAPTDPISDLHFVDVRPGKTVLLAVTQAGKCFLWDVGDDAILKEFEGRGQPPSLRSGYLRGGDSLMLAGRGAFGDDGVELIRLGLPGRRPAAIGEITAAGPAEVRNLGTTGEEPLHAVAGIRLDDGRLLAVAVGIEDRIQVWDASSRQLLAAIERPVTNAWAAELVRMRDGEVRIAVGVGQGVTIYSLDGQELVTLTDSRAAGGGAFYSVDFVEMADGTLLLAGVSSGVGVVLWNAESGALMHQIDKADATSVALGRRSSGRTVLAVGVSGGEVTVYDVDRGMQPWSVFQTDASSEILSAALTVTADDQVLVGVGHDSGVGIWDGATGTLLHDHQSGGDEGPHFASHADNHPLIVVVSEPGERGLLEILHAPTGRVVASVEMPRIGRSQPDKLFARVEGNTLVALVPASGAAYLVRLPLVVSEAVEAEEAEPIAESLPAGADALIGLAGIGLQPPLSLLQETTRLIGGASGAPAELTGLADHPGIVRLRALGWPPAARAGLAALLLRDLPADPAYDAPDHSRAELRTALLRALGGRPVPPEAPPAPLALLRAGADRVDSGTMTLLNILGPEAVAADPGLPLRMEQHSGYLPALDLDTRTLLARDVRDLISESGAHSPTPRVTGELAGTSRHGSISNLLRFQLALPPDLFRMQLAQDNLLYRLHVASTETEYPSVAIVLDTSPATFGPVEAVLRAVGHLLGLMVQQVCLIRTDEPGQAQPLADRTSLLSMWLGRGLDRPDLPAAMSTAAGCGMEIVVVLTDHHAAREQRLPADPKTRLLTTHVTGDPPARRPRTPFHVHLPPAPAPATLVRAAMSLIVPDPPWTGEVRAA